MAVSAAIRFSPPTLVIVVPSTSAYEILSVDFRNIEPGATALDLLTFLRDEGFAGLSAIPEGRLLALLDALAKQRQVSHKSSAVALNATGASLSDDFGDVSAAAALQATGSEDDEQFDADDLY
jgi:hypothetical protein